MDLTELIAVAAGVVGLLIGSFLNVVIYRVPRHESLLFPASHCPSCDSPIKARHNVPVVAWLALRGRCASCSDRISARYPLVEFGTGVLFAAIALRLGVSLYLPGLLFLAALGIALAMIDVDDQQVPGSMVAPTYLIGIALLLPAALQEEGIAHPAFALAGGLGLAAVCATAAMASQRAIEPGLVLLAGLIGFFLGWMSWLLVLVAAAASLALVLATRSALTTTGRRIGASTLPVGMLVLAASGLTLLLPIATL